MHPLPSNAIEAGEQKEYKLHHQCLRELVGRSYVLPEGNRAAIHDCMTADYDLKRFVVAQTNVLDAVQRELAAGRKQTHWMWFVFPQLAGLGRSSMARHYALGGLAEATAYLRHPVLGGWLIDCTEQVLRVEGRSASEIFGSPDDMKFHSSMTLFSRVPEAPLCFTDALAHLFDGKPDNKTLALLEIAT